MARATTDWGPEYVFFDDYPLFLDTSKTASSLTRLNLRHQAMIEANRDILAGARVLDLASHDGRWSFAALQAGAAHVTGVEARGRLVRNANKTFAEYGVEPDRYEFIRGDMFEVLRDRDFEVDVVLCLGFVYHTLRYPDLFHAIMKAEPQHCVIDTKVVISDEAVVALNVNNTRRQSHAAPDELSNARKVVAGWPSVPALHMLLDVYDFDVEQQFDWPGLMTSHPKATGEARDYAEGRRVTLRCRNRAAVDE